MCSVFSLYLVVALHVLTRALEAHALGVDSAEGVLQRTNQLVATVDLGVGEGEGEGEGASAGASAGVSGA